MSMMAEKRTNYLVTCRNHTPNCLCCKRCEDLLMNFVQYTDKNISKRGYYYKAQRSISFPAAQKFLEKNLRTTEFDLVALRGRLGKKRMKILKKGAKREAPAAQRSAEEEPSVTKHLKTSSSNGIRVEPSTKVLEEKIEHLSKKIKILERGQEKHTRRLEGVDAKIFKILDNQALMIKENSKNFNGFGEKISLQLKEFTQNSLEQMKMMNQASHQNIQASLQSHASRNQSNSNQAHRPSTHTSATKKSGPTYTGPQSEFPFAELLKLTRDN